MDGFMRDLFRNFPAAESAKTVAYVAVGAA
jgi:hypothetical protein